MSKPNLTIGHMTREVSDVKTMMAFYRDVLGFHISDHGFVGDTELAFMTQTPADHHQFVLVSGTGKKTPAVLVVDHVAFRTGSLDDLRALRDKLNAAKAGEIQTISHGNAWSIYFRDPEGNGIECFVDTPYHMAQPVLAQEFDLDSTDEEILDWTRELAQSGKDFQPMAQWKEKLANQLGAHI